MLDLEPATATMTRLVRGVRDDQLAAPTPCREVTVGDLLDHVDQLSLAFRAAAAKAPPAGARQRPSASRLGADWRTRIPQRLADLAGAWRDEAAWRGMTVTGGQELPGDLAGVIAVDEVLIHGWDIAVASGQPFACDPGLLAAAYQFVQSTAEASPHGTPGLFGPPVPVPADAALLDRLLGLAGRDPAWRAGQPATAG
jgi:uncharacterized protein (TIGR03086 family)